MEIDGLSSSLQTSAIAPCAVALRLYNRRFTQRFT